MHFISTFEFELSSLVLFYSEPSFAHAELGLGAWTHHKSVASLLLGPVDPSFRALPGRLKFTIRRHKFNKDSLLSLGRGGWNLGALLKGAAVPRRTRI